MKRLMQLAAGFGTVVGLAPVLYGTPLYHWGVFLPVLVGTMYGVARIQHWLHWRFSRRGIEGSRPNGTPFMPRRGTSA